MSSVPEMRTRTYRHRDLVGRIPTLVRRRDGSTWKFDRFEEVKCQGISTPARTERTQVVEEVAPYCGSENNQSVHVRYAPIYIKL